MVSLNNSFKLVGFTSWFVQRSVKKKTRILIMNASFTVLCPELSAPANGNVTFTSRNVGDTATYTCDVGFELIGNAMRTCTLLDPPIFDWSLSVPACRRKSKINDMIIIHPTKPHVLELRTTSLNPLVWPEFVQCVIEFCLSYQLYSDYNLISGK